MDSNKNTHLPLAKTTKDTLDKMRHPGQSYDGIIIEIIEENIELKNKLDKYKRQQGADGKYVSYKSKD